MKRPVVLALLFLLAAATLVAAPLIGMHEITPQALWEGTDATAMMIFWQLRVPRVLMAMLAGAALAASGMTFQALFRNPLAEPFTLGVASGASLGAMIYLHLGFAFSFLTVSGVAWFAFAGAVLAIAMVFSLTRIKPGFSSATLLLAGVAINFFFSSLILLVQYLSDFTQSYVMLRWMMGGLGRIVEFDDFFTMLPLVVAGTLIVAYFTHELNLISTGRRPGRQPRCRGRTHQGRALLRRVAGGRSGRGGLRPDRLRGAHGPAHLPASDRTGPPLALGGLARCSAASSSPSATPSRRP